MRDAPATHVVLSGCSAGGKSSLLAELARRGFATVPEPGRRIVEAALRDDGAALPWIDLAAFARRAIATARNDKRTAPTGLVFFDRGLVDAATALTHATGEPALQALGAEERYHRQVFLTPPWPELYRAERERRHDFAEAVAEYDRLVRSYDALGYATIILPKISIAERADFVLGAIAAD